MKQPANAVAAVEILRREMPEMTVASAEETYGFLILNPKGLDPDGRIDPVAARKVFDLRRLWGPQGKAIPAVGRFIDETYLRRAGEK